MNLPGRGRVAAGSAAKCEWRCEWRCGVCAAVCDRDALGDGPEGFAVDRLRCSGCMACVISCPAGLVPAGLLEGDRVG